MLKQLFFLLILAYCIHATSFGIVVQNQTCPDNSSLTFVLQNLPACNAEKLFSTINDGFIYSAKQFLDNTLTFVISSPNTKLYCKPYNALMGVLETLYAIALMIIGGLYIVSANDIQARTKSKIWLQNLMLMILSLTFAFPIFNMILEVNQYITTSIYNQSFLDVFDIQVVFSSLIFSFSFSTFTLFSAALAFFTLLVRYMLIPFLLLLFPIGILLYFLPFTKDWGGFILKFILLILFMTSFDAVLILGVSYLLNSGDPLLVGFIKGTAIAIGFGSIGFVNVIIYLAAISSVLAFANKITGGIISTLTKAGVLIALL